jgi:organic hydroperoxide reductase OsmC/OhrA
VQKLPHRYAVAAFGSPEGEVFLEADRLPLLTTAPPAEFGGPGDRWSPETLLAAAAADCFVLTFRAIARAAPMAWIDITCDVEGTLDRVDRVTRFTDMVYTAHLRIPEGTDAEQARRVLNRAKEVCLVGNSLIAHSRLEAAVEVTDARASESAA